MCKKLPREPYGTEYICLFSLLWHLNLYRGLSLDFSKHASFSPRWERERLVPVSCSVCQILSQSHQSGRLSGTLNLNISPELKYLNQTLRALRDRWGQVSVLALLPGMRSACCTDRHTPLCSLGEGRCAGHAMSSIRLERPSMEKRWPWVERGWPYVNLHSLCNPKALRKLVFVLLFSHSWNFLLYLKPARGEDFWKSSWNGAYMERRVDRNPLLENLQWLMPFWAFTQHEWCKKYRR